jgi:hypothetical protein
METLTVFYSTGRGLADIAKDALITKHYLRRMPPVSHAFMAMDDKGLAGVVTFGVPGSRHMQMSACPASPSTVLELNRLWVDDRMPKNTASRIVAAALARLPASIVVSYADTSVGHAGYVYRACNFFYAGWTDMERKTPRFDYVPRNGKHSRDAFRSNDFDRVRRKPKVRYWTITGDRREQRTLAKLSGWPKLSWKDAPPPMTA